MPVQVIALLSQSNWSCNKDLLELVQKVFAGVGSTKVVEDGFQRERHAETQGSTSRGLSHARKWMVPLHTSVLDKVHRFESVGWEGEVLQAGWSKKNLKPLHIPRSKDCSISASDITQGSERPRWYSPSPQTFFGHIADLDMYLHCRESGFQDAGNSWLSVLMSGKNLLVRESSQSQWFFPLASLGGVAAVGWPAILHTHGSNTFFTMSGSVTVKDLRFLHVHDEGAWVAVSCSWIGALRMKAMGLDSTKAPVAVTVDEPRPLMETLAFRAFDQLPKTALQNIGTHVGCAFLPTDDLVNVLAKLVKHVLPKLSDGDLIGILQKRANVTDDILELLMDADGEAMTDEKDEQKDFERIKRGESVTQTETKEYRKAFSTFKDKLSSGKSQSSGSRKDKRKKETNQLGKPYPAALPPDNDPEQWNVEVLRSFLPPDESRLYKDNMNRRYQVYWPSARKTRSNSWLLHGVAGAASRCLNQAWQDFEERGGFKRPFALPAA